jgi:type II secretory pathway predicted ATPase ExeA
MCCSSGSNRDRCSVLHRFARATGPARTELVYKESGVDEPERPSLADDPSFLARIDELDRGLIEGDGSRQSAPVGRHGPSGAAATAPVSFPREPAAGAGSESARPAPAEGPLTLLELFPPAPADGAAVRQPPLRASTSDTSPASLTNAPPARPAALPIAANRAILSSPLALASPGQTTCETFYGFSEKPFSLSPDPKFLYSSTVHEELTQTLLVAIRRRDGIVVLTGEAGTGKTTVCRAVAERLDRRTLVSFLIGPYTTIDNLLKSTLADFGVVAREELGRPPSGAGQVELSSLTRGFLESIASLQASAVVVVDDAQLLSDEMLEQIQLLCGDDAASRVLQIVLVGEPELAGVLRRPGLQRLRERISVARESGPIERDEVAGYVAHRLLVAGRNPRVSFTDRAVERLYHYSGGVPREINLLCDRALSLGYEEAAGSIERALIDRAAKELGIEAAACQVTPLLRTAAAAGVLAVLMLVGAGAAAIVFHERLQAFVMGWQSVPPLPPAPVPWVAPPFAAPSPPDLPSGR